MGMIIWDMREFRDPPKDFRASLPRRDGWSSWPSQDRGGVDRSGEDRVENGQNAEPDVEHLLRPRTARLSAMARTATGGQGGRPNGAPQGPAAAVDAP